MRQSRRRADQTVVNPAGPDKMGPDKMGPDKTYPDKTGKCRTEA